MSCVNTAQITGQHLLFLSTATLNWNATQFQQAAQFAKAHGIDTLLLKTADGANWWYGGLAGYRARRDIIKAEGVGVIPYTYSYGNEYGALDSEIDILIALMQEDGVVCADMEVEWNGQIGWAGHLASRMSTLQGVFLVSTWADPSLQDWQGVIQALAPAVDAFMPQQYNNYLSTFWWQFAAAGAACLQPTLDMTQDFGVNDPVSIARAAYEQEHTAISIWYFETAATNPALLDQILAAFPKSIEEKTMIDLSNSVVARYFSQGAGGAWNCKNGYVIGGAILKFYQSFGGNSLCGLTHLGLPISNEIGLGGGMTIQRFERGVLCYDPARSNDNPPGLDSSVQVYLMHIDKGPGEDPRVEDLQTEVSTLQGENDQLKALLASSNLGQIASIGKQIQDDIALIMKLVQIQ